METSVIFQYNNIDKPYLMLKLFDGEKLTRLGFISLNKNELENDLPIYEDLLVEVDRFLTDKQIERTNAVFVLNCFEAEKVTTVVPDINDRRTRKIYETDLANKLPNVGDYDRVSTMGDVKNGKVFYDFIVEKRFREFFEEFGKRLGFINIKVDNFYSYIFNALETKLKQKTYAYFYEEKGVASILVSINGVLSAYSSFENTENNYRLNISAIIDKHIYDLENAEIEKIYANKEIECISALNPEVRAYSIGG